MALPQEKLYTIEDIYALPDGTRAELIDGQVYYMSPPSRKHQRILSKLHQTIANYIDSKSGSCEVYPAPFAVKLDEDDSNYVEPDISVICDSSKLNDKGCTGAPDWIIEIVSPSSKKMDYYNKLFKYRTAGVKEYWIIDPISATITVHLFESDNSPFAYTFKDNIIVNIYEDFSIDFSTFTI